MENDANVLLAIGDTDSSQLDTVLLLATDSVSIVDGMAAGWCSMNTLFLDDMAVGVMDILFVDDV